jgi:YtkA-like
MIAAHAAALFAAALAAVACAAQTCGGNLVGTRHVVENARYAIAYTTAPDPIAVGQHFVVEFAVCARDGARPLQSVRVDANMPEHKHGMNYRPGVTTVRPGIYRAEGLLFHMPGRWELTFDVAAGNTTERMTDTLRLD